MPRLLRGFCVIVRYISEVLYSLYLIFDVALAPSEKLDVLRRPKSRDFSGLFTYHFNIALEYLRPSPEICILKKKQYELHG